MFYIWSFICILEMARFPSGKACASLLYIFICHKLYMTYTYIGNGTPSQPLGLHTSPAYVYLSYILNICYVIYMDVYWKCCISTSHITLYIVYITCIYWKWHTLSTDRPPHLSYKCLFIIYSKTFLSDHLHRSTTSLYRSLSLGSK